MSHLDKILIGAAALVVVVAIVYVIGWWHYACPRWFLGCTCQDLPGPALGPAEAVGADPGSRTGWVGELHHDDWDQLDPDQAADLLIAEWHDEPQERTVSRDVWDEWWAGMDGLDRECLLVTRWRHREEGLWAALVAETRELCAA